jgi:hypothetical protein
MRLGTMLGVGALAAAITFPALATPADDARCAVAGYAVGARAKEIAATSGDSADAIENLAVLLVMYFTGRLKDQPQANLEPLFKANAPPLKAPELGDAFEGCNRRMMEEVRPAMESMKFAEP